MIKIVRVILLSLPLCLCSFEQVSVNAPQEEVEDDFGEASEDAAFSRSSGSMVAWGLAFAVVITTVALALSKK